MFKVNMMSIIKVISAIFCVFLLELAAYSVAKSPASPIPAFICILMLIVVDWVIDYILVKKGKENSPYFDPEHRWKYGLPIYAIVCLIVIVMYRYLL